MFKHVLVTGGAGYVGCVLTPKLLAAGYRVTVYDLMLFGSAGLPRHPNLTVIEGDLRDTRTFASALSGAFAGRSRVERGWPDVFMCGGPPGSAQQWRITLDPSAVPHVQCT